MLVCVALFTGGKLPRRTALGADSSTLGGKRPMSSMTPTIVMKVDNISALSRFHSSCKLILVIIRSWRADAILGARQSRRF